jgi:type IV pilus assembly protein PilW
VNARGFTLLELMVGGTIGIMAIAMVLGVFVSQTASFQSLDLVRQMNGNARDASLELGNSIKRAGYGIDPAVAFDFSCPGQPPGTKCHDSFNGPDDLRFYARNPNYVYTPQNAALGCATLGGCLGGGTMWAITATSGVAQITATLGSGDVIQKGRTVLAICNDSSHPVYASVGARSAAGPGPIPITVTINSSTASTSLVGDTIFNGCHTTGFLLLVDQYHYSVTLLPTGALGTNEPWLVLDTGIDFSPTGALPATANLIPVARGVEDMQVAYELGPITGTAPDSDHDWVVGNNRAVAAAEEPDPTAARPINGVLNGTMNPANIRGVRVTLVVRSPMPDRSLGSVFLGDPAVKFENRSDVSAVTLGQFRRMPITLSAATRNMGSANPYLFY